MQVPFRYIEPERSLDVLDEVDVLVAGGGVAGLASAISAARNGAKTLLVERNGVVGGVATSGLMCSWGVKGRFWDGTGVQVVTGIPWEVHTRIIERGGGVRSALQRSTAPTKMVFDREIFIRVVLEMLEECGVEVLFHTQVCSVIKDGSLLRGVLIENKSGRQVVYAKQVIDATGEADICARAGVQCSPSRVDHSIMFRVGGVDIEKTYNAVMDRKEGFVDELFGIYDRELMEHDWNAGVFRGVSNSYRDLVCLDVFRDMYSSAIASGFVSEDSLNWMRHAEARKRSNGLSWGFDMQGIEARRNTNIAYIFGSSGWFDGTNVKETSIHKRLGYKQTWVFYESIVRKLSGFEKSYMLDVATDYGIRKGWHVATDYSVSAEDIVVGRHFEDVIGRFAMFHYWDQRQVDDPSRGFDIPYRQILPVGIDNLYVVGKPVSILRAMPSCMVMGEAAGTAAAIAAQMMTITREVNIRQLQKRLVSQGVNLGV